MLMQIFAVVELFIMKIIRYFRLSFRKYMTEEISKLKVTLLKENSTRNPMEQVSN